MEKPLNIIKKSLRVRKLIAPLLITFSIQSCSLDSQIKIEAPPDARARAHFIYHPKSHALLLLNGYINHPDSTQNNISKWDGKKWELIKADGPGSRIVNASALNNRTGNIEIFGGWGKGTINDKKNDLWEFDGNRWNKLPVNNIGTRDHHNMIFADHLDAFVVYGGFDVNFQPDTITWILKDHTLTPLGIAGPGPRGNFGFSYDPLRKKIILFGGKSASEPADLWEFDGKLWERIPVTDIGVTTIHSMVYDNERKMVVVQNIKGETWGWDGKVFTKLAIGGPSGAGLALGYDPKRKVIAAYGGFGSYRTYRSSLWELTGKEWKRTNDNGTWMQTAIDQYKRMDNEVIKIFDRVNELMSEKKLSEAEREIQKAIDAGILNSVLYTQLGEIKFNLKNYKEAVDVYEKLVTMEDVFPKGAPFYNLACGYVKLNDKEKAFSALHKAIENNYGSKGRFENDPDLEGLKSDKRWGELLKKMN